VSAIQSQAPFHGGMIPAAARTVGLSPTALSRASQTCEAPQELPGVLPFSFLP
jgi:hypothetical protein